MPDLNVVKRDFPFKRGSNYYITYKGEELILPSVTTILSNTIPKPFLMNWAAKQAATYALAHPGISVEEAVSASTKIKDDAAGRGKAIHSWAETHARGEKLDLNDLSETLQGYGKAFLQFIEDDKPKIGTIKGFPLTEFTVFNPEIGYAGTVDYATVTGYIYDWKTSKGIYLDHHLQQIAYLNATHILLPDRTIVKMPKFKGACLIHLRPTGGSSKHHVEGEFEDFLTVLEMYKVLQKHAF